MMVNFKIKSLQYDEFSKLFELDDFELAEIQAIRMKVDSFPGFPCRVSLQDAEIGEDVILLHYQHHRTSSPYGASGPIFIRKQAKTIALEVNEIPVMFNHRLLSLRCFDSNGIMQDASVVEGRTLRDRLLQLFENEYISYIHIHNAKPGCYNCLVERA
jgi:Protein of unknown function (DUF1203)